MSALRHVLIVEDEFVAALALEDFLTHEGYRVSLANDGAEALEVHRVDPADAVLTDLRMPRMGGRELIRRMREANPALPIVVMTGFVAFDNDPAELAGEVGGPIEVMRKPVDLAAIAAALRRLLRGDRPGTDAPDRRPGS